MHKWKPCASVTDAANRVRQFIFEQGMSMFIFVTADEKAGRVKMEYVGDKDDTASRFFGRTCAGDTDNRAAPYPVDCVWIGDGKPVCPECGRTDEQLMLCPKNHVPCCPVHGRLRKSLPSSIEEWDNVPCRQFEPQTAAWG